MTTQLSHLLNYLGRRLIALGARALAARDEATRRAVLKEVSRG